jgi:hypothetical protein
MIAQTDITEIKNWTTNKLLVEENNQNELIQVNKAENLYRLLSRQYNDLVCYLI